MFSAKRGASPVVVVIVLCVLAVAGWVVTGMISRTRQHEADKAKAAAARVPPLAVRLLKAPETMAVNQESMFEVEVKNPNTVAVLAKSGQIRYNVGGYLATEVKQDATFDDSADLPKDLQPGETVSMKLSLKPKTPLPAGLLVVRAYATRQVDGKAQGDWAGDAMTQKVVVK